MQRCRARFLCAGQDEIQPVNVSAFRAKHWRHARNRARARARCLCPITSTSMSMSRSKRSVVPHAGALYDPVMTKRFFAFVLWSLFGVAIACNTSIMADEGMWLFNAPPLKQLKEKNKLQPT